MKAKKYFIYAVLALLLLTPGLLSLMFYTLSDSVSDDNRDIALEIVDKKGNTYSFENTHDISILFHDIVNDSKKTFYNDGLLGFSENDAFKITLVQDGKKTSYDFFFDRTSPSGCLFRDWEGNVYLLKANKAIEFMDSIYASSLYPHSTVPQLTLNNMAAKPVESKWEYYSYSSVKHQMSDDTSDTPLSIEMSFLDFNMSFEKSPDILNIEVRDSLGMEFFSGSYAEFVMQGMFSTITESSQYTCTVKAVWNDIGSDCCGRATYHFKLSVDFDPPGLFWLNADTVECGGFVILSGKNIINIDSIEVTSIPALVQKPMFFKDGEYVRAILPISVSKNEIEYQIKVSYDGTFADLSFKTTVPKFNTNRDYNHSGRVNTSVRTAENLEELKKFITSVKYDNFIYSSSTFVIPSGIRAQFGDTVNNTNSSRDKFISNGIAFVDYYNKDYRGNDIVKAALGGMVVAVGKTAYGGNTVVVEHGLGLRSVYYCLGDVAVTKGSIVNVGDKIASGSARGGYTDGETAYIELWVGETPVSYRPLVSWGFGIDFGNEPSISEK